MFLDDVNVFLDDLNTNPITDEWYMSNFADKHIKILESYEAFDILKQFVDYMIEEHDEKSSSVCLNCQCFLGNFNQSA
ncbi:TPA: hypothetical protein WLF80_002165 [Neisseria gonorrhoeae]